MASRATRRRFFKSIRVRIVSGLRLARLSEIVHQENPPLIITSIKKYLLIIKSNNLTTVI
jgi:hypothetical protein